MTPDKLPEEITEKINTEADKYGFVVPYDGSNTFYIDDKVKGYQAGATAWAPWKVKHDAVQSELYGVRAENERLNESCNKLFKQSCQFNNDLVDVRAQAQRMADALELTKASISSLIKPAYWNQEISDEQRELIKTRNTIESTLQQFKDGKGKDNPCPHCGKELSRDRNLCCRECGKEVENGIH